MENILYICLEYWWMIVIVSMMVVSFSIVIHYIRKQDKIICEQCDYEMVHEGIYYKCPKCGYVIIKT